MSEWTQPIETVGELIAHLRGFDPDQGVRVAAELEQLRIALVLHSDDPRDSSTVFLAVERQGECTPPWVDDVTRGRL